MKNMVIREKAKQNDCGVIESSLLSISAGCAGAERRL